MMDWCLLFVNGLLGGAHCIGMCGGFVLALGGAGSRLLGNLGRQLVYGLGRVCSYTTAGAMAGYGGWRLSTELQLAQAQALLSIAAGLLLVVQGLGAAGVWRRRAHAGGHACLGPGLFGSLLRAARPHSVFLAGAINGLLPCGLVYAHLALAATRNSVPLGALTMALFGLGTLPVLVSLGCGGSFLGHTRRERLLRLAAWCVVLTGALTVARGVWAWPTPGAEAIEPCPFCP